MLRMTRVPGNDKRRRLELFALSTCGWCRKMKRLLDELGVQYEFIDVDLLQGEEKERARAELKKWNPTGSCPTLVIDDGQEVIVGFQEEKAREVLN